MMEIINIDARTFERLLSKIEHFINRAEALCLLHDEKDVSEWLDNQQVCEILNVSKRTLQTLRDNGTLTYSQISHKIYYKPQDVRKILRLVDDKYKLARIRGKHVEF